MNAKAHKLQQRINHGLELERIVIQLNDGLGIFLLIQISFSTIGVVGCSFASVSVLCNESADLKIGAFYCLLMTSLCLLQAMKLYKLCFASHNLSEAMVSCASQFEEAMVQIAAINDKECHAIEILCKRLKRESPISPMSYFRVGKPTLVSIFAAVCTYMVILLQFKVSGKIFVK